MSARFTTTNKTSDKEELQDFINGLVGDDWKGLAICHYKGTIADGKTHKEAMKEVYSALLEVANKVLPEEQSYHKL